MSEFVRDYFLARFLRVQINANRFAFSVIFANRDGKPTLINYFHARFFGDDENIIRAEIVKNLFRKLLTYNF